MPLEATPVSTEAVQVLWSLPGHCLAPALSHPTLSRWLPEGLHSPRESSGDLCRTLSWPMLTSSLGGDHLLSPSPETELKAQ